MRTIREMVQQEFDAFSQLNHIDPMRKLLLERGKEYPGSLYHGQRGKKKECFSNALHLALRVGGTYVEGLALSGSLLKKDLAFPIYHAWALDPDGNLLDNTWDDPATSQYLGIEFDAEWAASYCVKQGYYGLFQGSVSYNLDLINRLLALSPDATLEGK